MLPVILCLTYATVIPSSALAAFASSPAFGPRTWSCSLLSAARHHPAICSTPSILPVLSTGGRSALQTHAFLPYSLHHEQSFETRKRHGTTDATIHGLKMQGWGGGGYDRGDRDFGRRDSRRPRGRGGGGGGDFRPGDWACPECSATVFGSKYECYRCGCPKPENARPASGNDGVRPGDWECPECSATVFGSKYECFRCGCPKPENAKPAQASGWGDGGGRGGRQGPWTRAQDDSTEVDEDTVLDLMAARDDARADRDYATADQIREELSEQFSVHVDDALREWWVGQPRDNRDRGGATGVWTRWSGDSAEIDEAEVMEMILSRAEARRARDFSTADELREVLQQDLGVALDDRTMQWWVGEPGGNMERGGARRRGQGPWSRAPHDQEEVDEEAVLELLLERDEARAARDFMTADDVRDALQSDWGVAVDDDVREWWVGDRRDNRDRKFGRGGGGGWGGGGRERGGGRGGRVPFSEPFQRSGDTSAPVDEGAVGDILAQREQARKARDYREADGLRDMLQMDYGVTVDDEQREWWVGDRPGNRVRKFNEQRGDAPPPGSWGAGRDSRRRGGGGGTSRRGGGGGGRRGGGGGWRSGGDGGGDNYGWD